MAGKPHPLQAAADVAHSREGLAVVEQQQRLQQLILFRGEYAMQFQQEGSGGISARRFQDYAAFLNNLDQGITQSQQQLMGLRQDIQRRQKVWVQMRAKTKALEELIDQERKAQIQREGQREQRDNDERNLRSPDARQRATGGDGG